MAYRRGSQTATWLTTLLACRFLHSHQTLQVNAFQPLYKLVRRNNTPSSRRFIAWTYSTLTLLLSLSPTTNLFYHASAPPYTEVDCPYPLNFDKHGSPDDFLDICPLPCPLHNFSEGKWWGGYVVVLVFAGMSFTLMVFSVATWLLNPKKRCLKGICCFFKFLVRDNWFHSTQQELSRCASALAFGLLLVFGYCCTDYRAHRWAFQDRLHLGWPTKSTITLENQNIHCT